MKAWIFQDDKQVKKHGSKKASWQVGWLDPEGKRRSQSCGPGSQGKKAAFRLKQKIEAELLEGTYRRSNDRKTWQDFRAEYETKIAEGMKANTRNQVISALNHFERLIKPKRMKAIKTQAIDEYKARRRLEPGKKGGSLVSKATINKELRHLRAVMRKAFKWNYLPAPPDFSFERESKRLPTYVIPDHFATIYQACDHALKPADQPFSPADWWRGLLVMGYMTGWRISELLGFRRNDLDLEEGTAITRAEDNKGERDDRVKLHPVVIAHLRKLKGFTPAVFPWHQTQRGLFEEFTRIQELAGIRLPCSEAHTHSRFCYTYGFHDLRRAFASMNADRLTADALQALMRHKSYATTQRYINMARQLDSAVDSLFVPDVLNGQKSARADVGY